MARNRNSFFDISIFGIIIMSKPRSPLQQRFPPPPPRRHSSPATSPLAQQSKSQSASRFAIKEISCQKLQHPHMQHSSFPISPPLNANSKSSRIEKEKVRWEENQLNESMTSRLSENSNQLHDSALEISKHIQSMDHESVNSFVETIKDDTSISILINSLQHSKRGEEGHMESIIGILEKNKEVIQSADQILEIFDMAKQIARINDCCPNDDDDDDDESTRSSLSHNAIEIKPAQGTRIANQKSQQPPPPPHPTLKPPSPQLNRLYVTNQRDRKKEKQKQTRVKVRSVKREEIYRSQASDTTDSVVAMADRLANTRVIDEPSVIQGPDDTGYWGGMRGCSKEKTGKRNGRVYKQIAGDNCEDETNNEKATPRNKKSSANSDTCNNKSRTNRTKSTVYRQREELRKKRRGERKQTSSRKQQPRCTTVKLPQTDKKKGIAERLVKKKTQISMVSNTTASTVQSTPSLLGQQINLRSSKSVGSNHSRSQVSRTSSKKSSFSRKSRLSRASSLHDDESLESGSKGIPGSVGDNPHPIFVLPAPTIDEISVCASSLSCRSGRSLRQASESGASSMSCRSGRSLPKQQLPQSTSEDNSWMNKVKARLFRKKKT
mmetsp:Transcript_12469/g.24894  ORF Transcript_12469/g.24894 Transcript_12469/m.24894 type:complete len:607 (+) Transcript_12469:130-1950(+)